MAVCSNDTCTNGLTQFVCFAFRLFNTERVKILDGGSRLKIANISSAENGIYSCRAENVAGAVDSSTNFLLNVQGKKKLYKHLK